MSAELNQLIRSVVTGHPGTTDLHEIAKLVADQTPKKLLHEFYRETLALAIADLLRNERTEALSNAVTASSESAASSKPKSAKMTARRDWWAKMLISQVHVASGQKFLADCTVEDLQYCIATREEHIARVAHQISNYQYLIDQMKTHGAEKVSDLPPLQDWDAA